MKPPGSSFQVLKAIQKELADHFIEARVIDDSVCTYREVPDRHSKRDYLMMSAVCIPTTQEQNLSIYCVEHYDGDQVVKYTIKINDRFGKTLSHFDLSSGHGHHEHQYVNGIKNPAHLPSTTTVEDIAEKIAVKISQLEGTEP